MNLDLFNSLVMGIIAGGIINIYKDNLNKKRYIIDRNKVRRLCKLNISKIKVTDKKAKYSNSVEYFNNVIKDKLPYVSLDNFKRNIDDLIITEFETDSQESGSYEVNHNIITLLENDRNNSITHELFHLSSSVVNGKRVFSGFSQASNDFSIGRGINEGYTSLLDKRYFENDSSAYQLFQVIDILIEKIIGQEKMTKMYFEADLYGLIETLSKYCYEDTAYELIKDIDILHEKTINDVGSYSEEKNNDLQKTATRVTRILLSCYINYLKTSAYEGLISISELETLLLSFVNAFPLSYEDEKYSIKFYAPEILDELIEKNFSKNMDGSSIKMQNVSK